MNIEVPIGDIVDKITILEIKRSLILDPDKRININKELAYLLDMFDINDISTNLLSLRLELKQTNEIIWHAEDLIRKKEREKEFDDQFIQCARTIYKYNDHRALLKKKINELTNSEFTEEKSYEQY